jgi:POT family proton-dependent oligopeptide transporter
MPSPVGLSYVARVAPARYASRLMAAWFVAEAAGNKLAGSLAAYSETIQAGLFYAIFVAIAMVSKIALLMATPVLKRLTAES